MWPLVKDFFTVKSAAVRTLRVLIVTGGGVLTSSVSPLPLEWRWAGVLLAAVGAAITGRDKPE